MPDKVPVCVKKITCWRKEIKIIGKSLDNTCPDGKRDKGNKCRGWKSLKVIEAEIEHVRKNLLQIVERKEIEEVKSNLSWTVTSKARRNSKSWSNGNCCWQAKIWKIMSTILKNRTSFQKWNQGRSGGRQGEVGWLSPPMKLHGKNILKCISNNVVSQRRSLKEFQLFLCLLNVSFKIFCRKYQTPKGRNRGEQGEGEGEDEEGRNYKFSFVFFCKHFFPCKYFVLFYFFSK